MNKKKNNLRPLKAKLDIYPLSTYEKREFYQIKTKQGNFIKISAEVKILLDLMVYAPLSFYKLISSIG